MIKYKEYIQSDEWREKRLKYLRSKLFKGKCYICRIKMKSFVHVHHKTYKRLGNEYLKDLVGLCEACHKKLHSELKTKQSKKFNLYTAAKRMRRKLRNKKRRLHAEKQRRRHKLKERN